jgi:cytosine/adenosine deaminase-related metal-dependent hydrolase
MFAEMRLAALLQKLRHGASALTAPAVAEMATIEGARCLNWDHDIGSLEVGKKADLVAIDLDAPHSCPNNFENIYAQIVFSAKSCDVRLTMVDGRICYENGELTGMDIDAIMAHAKTEWDKLLRRV